MAPRAASRTSARSASPSIARRTSKAAPAVVSLLSAPPPEALAKSKAYAEGSHVSPTIMGGFWGRSNVASMVICGGLVAAGALGAADVRLWLRCFGGLLLFLSALTLGGAAFMWAACRLCGRKMQPAGRETPPLIVEALDSLRAMFVFAALGAWPAAAYAAGHKTAIVFSLDEAMPGWSPRAALALYLLQLVALTLVVDLYSHFKHKAMHTTMLWDFHKTHHTYRDPSPFAGFAVHPVEAFLTFVPVLGMLRPEMPVWAHAYALWTVTWFFINLYLHSGYEVGLLERILAPLLINSSGYHNYHHELMYTNFSELLYVWDLILGTGFHPTGFGWGRSTPKFGKIRPRV